MNLRQLDKSAMRRMSSETAEGGMNVGSLRVGLFSECFRPIQNGIVASIESLAYELRERGHEPVVVTPWMPHQSAESGVVRLPSLGLPTRTAYRMTLPSLPASLGALSIVHAHSPFVTGWLARRAARSAGVPLVFTYHTLLEEYAHYVPFDTRATRAAATRLTRAFANNADTVIVPTMTIERRLRAAGVRAHIDVIPSGIDVAAFARGRRSDVARARFGVGANEHLILAVGRLGREKNVELALEAFALLPGERAHFVAIGDGPHRPVLERYARAAGIAARVHFVGELPRAALPDAYACADAFIFTSQTETQGLVLVEALAAGVPILAVEAPQTRDVLAECAVFVAADARALAGGIERILGGETAAVGRGAALARFEQATMGERILALYRALLEHRQPRSAPARNP